MFIKLDQDESIIAKAYIDQFTEAMCESGQSVDHYVKTRMASSGKATKDIRLGKMAEFIVAKAMHYISFPKIEPDFTVFTKKSWDADLSYSKFGFPDVHVKACSKWTFDYCKDYSWTFQYSRGRDTLFNDKTNDLIALVYLDNCESTEGEIKAILPWREIKDRLKDPIKKEFVGIKKCLYYKDLYVAT